MNCEVRDTYKKLGETSQIFIYTKILMNHPFP